MAPRLPTAEDLGGPGSYNSGRGIASYDVTALAKGAKDLGTGAQNLGNAVMTVGLQKMREGDTAADQLGSARADAAWMTDRINLNKEVADASDPDALTSGQPAKYKASLERAAQFIPEGEKRDLWMTRRQAELATAEVGIKDKAFNLNRDRSLAEDQETLRIMSNQAATASPDDRKRIEGIAASIFQGWKDNGYVDEQKIASARSGWANGYAVTTIQALTPQQRIEALTPVQTGERSKTAYQFYVSKGWSPAAAAGIVGGLIHEGGLRTNALNPGDGADGSDSIGIAQWNSGRAQQLKAFATAQGKDWRDFGVQLAFVDHELRTTEKDAAGRLNAATTPREAAEAFVRYERPKNFEKGATAAHGWGNRLRQAEGVFASYGGGKLPPARGEDMAAYLSPEQKRSILVGSERELDNQYREQQQARAADRATVQSLMKDDQASIVTTGMPVADLTTDRVKEALGPDAAATFEQGRAQATEYHHQTKDWDAIPADEIRARLEALRPAAGAPGFASGSSYFDAAEKRASEITKERRTDPAAAVDRMADVATAKQGASLDNPASYQPVAKARAIAMERLRIPEDLRVPMTRAEAMQTWKPLDLAVQGGDPKEIKETLQATIEQLKEAFGDQADTALNQVLKEGHADRTTRELTASILKRLARNEAPSQQDMRALDDAQKTAAADRASTSLLQQLGMDTLDANGQPVDTAPKAPTFPTPDPDAIKMLRGKPELGAMFDRTYGPGASAKVLALTGGAEAR